MEITLECTGTGELNRRYECNLLVKLENENAKTYDYESIKVELYTKTPTINHDIKTGRTTTNQVPNLKDSLARSTSHSGMGNKMGFSFVAFLINLFAFAFLGTIAVYLINTFLKMDEVILIIVIIVVTAAAFGISVNHGITVGTNNKNKKK